jgi:hypothetical protein
MNILILDLYYDTPATAMAASNLVRCFLGAGAAAVVNLLINNFGMQWTYGLVAGAMALVTSLLIVVYSKGWQWHKKQADVDTQQQTIHEEP